MALNIIRHDNRFRVEGPGISFNWLPDTAANRQGVVVFLRWVTDEGGKPLFTYQELAGVLDSANRQAAFNHLQEFNDCGRDFLLFLSRRKKLDSTVVQAIQAELLKDPFATCAHLQDRVNARLGRTDLTERNLQEAMDLIPLRPFRTAILQQLEKGEAHYSEKYLLEEMMTAMTTETGKRKDVFPPDSVGGMELTHPSGIKSLMNPKTPLSEVSSPLRWLSLLMVLYYHGLPLSVYGSWFSVHKTTVLRWILGASQELWPIVSQWLVQQVKGTIVIIDEKWLKIQGKWYDWFVVLDHDTGLPILGSLLATKSQWACRWIGTQLTRMGVVPKVILTDGLLSYQHVMEGAKHICCLFHHQQGVTHWLKKHFADKAHIQERKAPMKRVFQSQDKRTVKRRLAKLKTVADRLGIGEWVTLSEGKMEHLLPAVGSQRLPSTTNAIERFFRAFNRFIKVRCGF